MRELARELLAGEEAWVVGGAVRDELLGRGARRPGHRRPGAAGGCAGLCEALRRCAVPALRTTRRLAGCARSRAHGRLHAVPGDDRGRPCDARLHDQRDRGATRRRRRGRPVRGARRPRRGADPRRLAVRVHRRPAAADARGAPRGRARLPARARDRAPRCAGTRRSSPSRHASGRWPSWCGCPSTATGAPTSSGCWSRSKGRAPGSTGPLSSTGRRSAS